MIKIIMSSATILHSALRVTTKSKRNLYNNNVSQISRNVRKRTFRHVHPAKIQIRLRNRAVWSESSLGAFWIAKRRKVSSCGQQSHWSDRMEAQADLSLRWMHMLEGTFSHVTAKCPIWEKASYAIWDQWRPIYLFAHLRSLIRSASSSVYAKISNKSISGQRMPWSVCANA